MKPAAVAYRGVLTQIDAHALAFTAARALPGDAWSIVDKVPDDWTKIEARGDEPRGQNAGDTPSDE